ncbi:aspartate aminotransferase family protein [Pantoea ananatis]|uniref:aspartate aminotransferase family protein n=1 Tax=Pantoea ananas TaxID=553 RepID=UPI000FEC8A7B|nr:aspartate aminotransferase family protein [Pantoea ananatis]QAB29150.1 aspartate aminotransferase family protein [Pantoea ananatis]
MKPALMVNAYDPSENATLDTDTAALIARRTRVLGPSYKLFYKNPVHIVRSEGVWLYDQHGNGYLDVYNNVPAVGHCHPAVIEAVNLQLRTLNTHTRYLNDVVLDYAERLVASFPAALSNVMFTCTGSESSDLALRIARCHTGGTGIIVTDNAYHGITAAVAEMSPSLGKGVPLGAHVRVVPAPNAYHQGEENTAGLFTAAVRNAIADLQRHGIRPAALVTDTIFSSDGIYSDPAGFLQGAVAAIREAGGLFIADEVQPGFGRLGSHMWGFQRHGIVPDLVILGKPMGNGIPIGGVVAQPEYLQRFASIARYFNTFGGNPVSCAAGMAVLDVIEKECLQQNAAKTGQLLINGLNTLAKRFPVIGNVRGSGLFIGAELVRDSSTQAPAGDYALDLVNRLRERHILISACGKDSNVLKIRPPLVFSAENAQYLLSVMSDVMEEMFN